LIWFRDLEILTFVLESVVADVWRIEKLNLVRNWWWLDLADKNRNTGQTNISL